MADFSPTPEQDSIVEAVRSSTDSLMVKAYAGCAKTTTILLAAKALPVEPALALAFNKKIQLELEKKLPSHFAVKTMNGLGHSAWSQAIGRRLTIDDRKLGKCVTEAAQALDIANLPTDDWDDIRRLVSAAMARGLIPKAFANRGQALLHDNHETWTDIADQIMVEPKAYTIDVARKALTLSIQQSYIGIISFDDQIYMSALFGGVFPRFPRVIVDEAQDLSPLNHIQLARSSAGWLAAVGDPKQAIYQFRGADAESMGKIRALRGEWQHRPLATTFRCPKVIVERQQLHAPGFTAWHTNAEGVFESWTKWGAASISTSTSCAVLCRNNAPLLSLGFKLLRRRVPVQMLGRDIGKGLVSLFKKIVPDLTTSVVECAALLTAWQTKETTLALANNKPNKLDGIEDRAESLRAVIEGSEATTGHEIIRALENLFSYTTGRVTLSTGHRAKGLEWDLVVHLDPWRVPSKFAIQASMRGNHSQLEQEHNLQYVIETRARHTLVEANLEDFQ